MKEPIMIGAEVFIEPGQTADEIDGWFRIMKEGGMKLTRIRMFENYMHKADDTWDFTLFDQAFLAGEKYGINIYANLFPETDFSDVGGFKFHKSAENLEGIANYIKHLVMHFSKFSSLYGWVPINEPGAGELPEDQFIAENLKEWNNNQAKPPYQSNGFTTFEFAEQRFLVHYNSWFLKWLTEQIRLYDPVRPVHVNNHDIFRLAAEYDFPGWRTFLTSLGGSAHASWHFRYFTRDKYAVAMSANAEMLRSGAGDISWLMTELQGGNNTYSGYVPMCPTKEEIVQWLWTNLGSGSRGALFWSLNPRRSGFEAGEWALLDFQDQPSDRMEAATSVCRAIAANHDLFDLAEVADSGISILYTRESMWIEKALQIKGEQFEGRETGGVMKSALGYFEALTEMGVHANFKEMGEYDFDKDDFSTEAIILSHQISIPSKYWASLDRFVANGGKLIVDGLTAYYDENAYFIMGPDFPLKHVFGGLVKEFKMVDNLFDVHLDVPDVSLTAHLWMGNLLLSTATATGYFEGKVISSKNSYGKGEVVWLPSLLGLGARLKNDYGALVRLLSAVLKPLLDQLPVCFLAHHKGMLMKVLKGNEQWVTVLINKSGQKQTIILKNRELKNAVVLFANKGIDIFQEGSVSIAAEETVVLKWDRK